MKYTHVMFDVETMATAPDAVILSLGAQAFDEHAHLSGQPHLGPALYSVLEIEGQRAGGRRVDPETMLWWSQQSEGARAVLDEPTREPVRLALERLAAFVQDCTIGRDHYRPWGNGASFDLTLLEDLHRWAGKRLPWKYHNQRCFRTLKSVFEEDYQRAQEAVGRIQYHNAADDARWQSEMAVRLLRRHDAARAVCEAADKCVQDSGNPSDYLEEANGRYQSL